MWYWRIACVVFHSVYSRFSENTNRCVCSSANSQHLRAAAERLLRAAPIRNQIKAQHLREARYQGEKEKQKFQPNTDHSCQARICLVRNTWTTH